VKFQNSLIAALIAAILTFHVTKPDTPVDPNRPVDPVVTPVDPNAPGTPVTFTEPRALILEHTENPPLWLVSLMANAKVKAALDTRFGEGGWRRWDDQLLPTNALPWLRELSSVPRQQSPSIVIADRGKAVAYPLPQTDAAMIALLGGR
jgi:hypothetical protein